MNDFQRRAQYRRVRKRERVEMILARSPYNSQSALYYRARKELMNLSEDVLLLLSHRR